MIVFERVEFTMEVLSHPNYGTPFMILINLLRVNIRKERVILLWDNNADICELKSALNSGLRVK